MGGGMGPGLAPMGPGMSGPYANGGPRPMPQINVQSTANGGYGQPPAQQNRPFYDDGYMGADYQPPRGTYRY